MQMKNMKKQEGLTLVELMVSITIGLILLVGLATVYERNSSARNELERSSRQLENGRYAIQLLSADIKLAGYLGEFYDFDSAKPPVTPIPGTPPTNPCWAAPADPADLLSAFPFHVQGYDNGSGLSCISDYKGGDVIVVRRVSTCSVANPADANCDAVAPYFQVSGCGSDTVSFKLGNDATPTLKKIGCDNLNLASQRRFLTHIYYVANNNKGNDGIPTLKRWELGTNAIVPLVEGIENLQFEYGVDSDNNGSPNNYSSAEVVGSWFNVVAVKIHLLSRNETPSPGYADTKSYLLGTTQIPAPRDSYRRHVFSTTVILENPAGRRQ